MNDEELERKLKKERVEVCLHCKKFVKCDDIGEFEECIDFEEVDDEAWVMTVLSELIRLGRVKKKVYPDGTELYTLTSREWLLDNQGSCQSVN